MAPGLTEPAHQPGAGPPHQLVSWLDGAAAVEQNAALVLHRQQVGLLLVAGTVHIPVG